MTTQLHFKVICSECNKVIMQCKCMKCNQDIRMSICDDCKQKQEMWNKREGE